jgi:hypothetical protein
MLVLSKAFTNQAFNPVTSNSTFNVFARNGQSQACCLLRCIVPEYCEICIAETMIVLKNTLEQIGAKQPLATGKSLPALIDYRALVNDRLNAKALTTFGAACTQYLTATTCAHARTKAVCAFAF